MKNIDEMGIQKNQENEGEGEDKDEDSQIFQCRMKHKQYHGLQLWGTVRAAD